MDRRDSLKTLLVGSLAGGALITAGCNEKGQPEEAVNAELKKLYGRTPKEKEHDEKLHALESIFTETDLTTIAILCDIILPATDSAGSATEAEVPDFIDFIVKDIPKYQIPIKGGLMWLNRESALRFENSFTNISESERIQIIDDIAYPDRAKPDMGPGVAFFNSMRDLTLTGYYTSRMGLNDLGYKGNVANAWDGVPENVLKNHDVDYDPEWIAKCVDQNKRTVTAEWDEAGNLLT